MHNCKMKKNLTKILIALIVPITISGWEFQPVQEPLLENVIYRTFSNPSTKDKFSISISGTSIVDGTMKFTISTSEGVTIHLEEYPSNYLIGYGLGSTTPPTLKEEEDYIKKRVAEFFNDDNFSSPAIGANDEIDTDYSNEEDWNDIRSDQTAVGFYYLIAEEAGCQIAYSKKNQKTIKYFCCC
jgi:hypothetical protein